MYTWMSSTITIYEAFIAHILPKIGSILNTFSLLKNNWKALNLIILYNIFQKSIPL